jgi:hypothetical protein
MSEEQEPYQVGGKNTEATAEPAEKEKPSSNELGEQIIKLLFDNLPVGLADDIRSLLYKYGSANYAEGMDACEKIHNKYNKD